MARRKTGGGVGTNQYRVRGHHRLHIFQPALPAPLAQNDKSLKGHVRLVASKNPDIRAKVAKNPDCPTELLIHLSNDINYKVRSAVAGNPAAPAALLAATVNDNHYAVLQNLGTNFSCPPETLRVMAIGVPVDQRKGFPLPSGGYNAETMARMTNHVIASTSRRAAVTNPNCPPDVLAMVANDSDIVVRQLVATHPSTPPEILTTFAQDNNYNIRQTVATNPSLPPEVLVQLAQDRNINTRRAALNNPNFPAHLRAIINLGK